MRLPELKYISDEYCLDVIALTLNIGGRSKAHDGPLSKSSAAEQFNGCLASSQWRLFMLAEQ